AAPAMIAAKRASSSPKAVRMRQRVPGTSERISRQTSTPFPSGSRTSSTATSGAALAICLSASWLVDACPTTSMPGSSVRIAATVVRPRRPGLPVCFYGLYATGPDGISGEYEAGLLGWLEGLTPDGRDLRRSRFHLPVRSTLPPLDRYAQLAIGESRRTVGYV